jgi:hypothetical protein
MLVIETKNEELKDGELKGLVYHPIREKVFSNQKESMGIVQFFLLFCKVQSEYTV